MSLAEWIPRLADVRVVVVGDLLLDEFVECAPVKLCSEGPVPVLARRGQRRMPGGAGNAAANAARLGAQVSMVGALGDDEPGRELRGMLEEAGVDLSGTVVDAAQRTHRKVRILAGGSYVVRVDEGLTELGPAPCRALARELARAVGNADLLVVSDYGLGFFSPRLIRALARLDRPLTLLDSKRATAFRRIHPSVVTPNLPEALELAGGGPPPEDEAGLRALAGRVRTATGAERVALTLGARGAYLAGPSGAGVRVEAGPVRARSDVGAGDSFAAALGLALAAGCGQAEAMTIAVEAAGLVVAKPYTALVTAQELASALAVLDGMTGTASDEERDRLVAVLEEQRRRGRRIVLTNGVFDLLHPGHVDFLSQARGLGDVLVVAVNDDAGARRLKGPARPVLGQQERQAMLAALDCVDHVLTFAGDTACELVRRIRPDVYVKGSDHRIEELPEAAVARSVGARVEILPRNIAASTTAVIDRVSRLSVAG